MANKHAIVVEVRGGVAYVSVASLELDVFVVDHDNAECATNQDELTRGFDPVSNIPRDTREGIAEYIEELKCDYEKELKKEAN